MAKDNIGLNKKNAEKLHTTMINKQKDDLPFGRGNYTFMLIGLGLIALGFLIMTQDKEEFGFGFLGITLGPIIVFLGFMIEIYAILKKKD